MDDDEPPLKASRRQVRLLGRTAFAPERRNVLVCAKGTLRVVRFAALRFN